MNIKWEIAPQLDRSEVYWTLIFWGDVLGSWKYVRFDLEKKPDDSEVEFYRIWVEAVFKDKERKRANRFYRFFDDARASFYVWFDRIWYEHIFLTFYDPEGKFRGWKEILRLT